MFNQDFLSSIIHTALSRGGDYCDVFIEEKDNTAVRFDNGKIRTITTGKTGECQGSCNFLCGLLFSGVGIVIANYSK